MNRIVKFRGKKKTPYGERWIEGYYSLEDGEHVIIVPHIDSYKESLKDGKPLPTISVKHVIDINTLGQYIDLKDWDEKEVYEGDIIQYLYDGCGENDQYIVEWDEENLQYSFKNTRKSEYMTLEDMYDCDYGKYSIRVIGNIYDNPELLKEE